MGSLLRSHAYLVRQNGMTIKFRILLLTLLFQVVGFAVLVSFNNDFLSQEQDKAVKRELNQTINAAVVKIDQSARHIQSKTHDLSILAALLVSKESLAPIESSNNIAPFNKLSQQLHSAITLEKDIYKVGVWFKAQDSRDESWGFDLINLSPQPDISIQRLAVNEEQWFQDGLSSAKGIGSWVPAKINDQNHLVMRHIQPITDQENTVLGVIYLDWDLKTISDSLEKIEVSRNAFTFLIDKRSKEVLSYLDADFPSTQKLVNNVYLANHINLDVDKGVHLIEGTKLLDEQYLISYSASTSGLIFGAVTPYSDINKFVNEVAWENTTLALMIVIAALALSFIFINMAFEPLRRIVYKINQSIRIDQDGIPHAAPIKYKENNEFTRITFALNKLFDNVNENIRSLHKANQEIEAWNQTLDEKVAQKTEALRAKQKDLEYSLQQLKETQDELIKSEKMAALGNLVAGVAHEINTPIGISVTAISFLEQRVKTLKEQFESGTLTKNDFGEFCLVSNESTQIISTNLNRAAELIKSFKMVAVDQSNQTHRELNLKAYIDDVMMSLKPKLKKTQHHIDIDIPFNLMIVTDPGSMSQAITIMIMNSLIHGFHGIEQGTISISAQEESEHVILTYTDNGKGVSTSELEKLFDPFYTTKRGEGGSGLGTHILYNIVTQVFKGKISATSSIDHGLTYTITIPKDANEDEVA